MKVNISTIQEVFRVGRIPISNTICWTVILMALTFAILMWLSSNMKVIPTSKKQVIAEFIVTKCRDFVKSSMGDRNEAFAPYFLALAAFILVSNLSGLLFLNIVRPPTADVVTTLTMGIFTFILTQFFAIKTKGIVGYLKGFLDPIFILLPINIIGELANPVSLGFRLFGNMTGGLIIISLCYSIFVGSMGIVMFTFITTLLLCLYIKFGKPNKFTQNKVVKTVAICLLVPSFFLAFCHVYFDMFSGILQTFIFCMLSMVFISSAMADEES